MIARLLCCFALLLCLMACTSGLDIPATPVPINPVEREQQEYAIYAVVVADLGGGVIRDHTETDPSRWRLDYAISQMGGVTAQMKEDFLKQNAESSPVKKQVGLKDYTFIGEEALHAVWGSDLWAGWERFHQQYGPQLITLTRVGFNSDMTLAFLYAAENRNPLNAAGFDILLAKENGAWTIRKKYNLWVA